jgi:hypothetical protein
MISCWRMTLARTQWLKIRKEDDFVRSVIVGLLLVFLYLICVRLRYCLLGLSS